MMGMRDSRTDGVGYIGEFKKQNDVLEKSKNTEVNLIYGNSGI